ncbi:MAG: ABC transporter ATP-binding protein [Nocardioides sp.]
MEAIVSLQRASRIFESSVERVVAVDCANISASPGEFICLFGHSGSGKTTLLNLIAGLDRPNEGSVWVAGREVSDLSDEECITLRREVVGVVHQTDALIEEFTAQENVALPLEAGGSSTDVALREAGELLALVGLEGLDRRFPSQLSGGQRQRVGIARALSGNRVILLADEPTGALDTKNALAIFELLRGLAESGVLVIIASHDPRSREYATRWVEMLDGVIVGDESAQ